MLRFRSGGLGFIVPCALVIAGCTDSGTGGKGTGGTGGSMAGAAGTSASGGAGGSGASGTGGTSGGSGGADGSGGTSASACSTVSLGFDSDLAGSVPAGIQITETNGTANTATWEVKVDSSPELPSPPNAFGVTASTNSGDAFNLALVETSTFRDVDVTAWIRAIAGSADQGGGVVWRAKDNDNYYVARWNPLEANARVYKVEGGVRTQLSPDNAGVDAGTVVVDPGSIEWHQIRVVMQGTHVKLLWDYVLVLELDDTTFTSGGMIGLWTKGDAQTLFDDFTACESPK